MKGIQEDEIIIDSGYAESKNIYNTIKEEWKKKNPAARVVRVRTDTKGLINYDVVIKEED